MANAGFQTFLAGVKAGADLSAATNQYKLVKINAARQVILCNGTGDRPHGVLINTPKSGMPATVVNGGEVKIQAATGIAAGNDLQTDANGQAKVAVSSGYVFGHNVDTSAAQGGLLTCHVNFKNPWLKP